MMFVVPYYLLRLGGNTKNVASNFTLTIILFSGVYNVEELFDITWSAISYSINLLYHFIILQGVAIVSLKLFYFLYYITEEMEEIESGKER